MFGKSKKSEDSVKQTLSDIARGIQYSVNTAEQMVEEHYVKMLSKYFNSDMQPIMSSFKLNDDNIIEVPLISLVTPAGLMLDEVTIDMAVLIDGIEVKEAQNQSDESITTRTSFEVSFAPSRFTNGKKDSQNDGANDKTVHVQMKFKAGDPPEGVARVIDEYTKLIVKKKGYMPQETNQS